MNTSFDDIHVASSYLQIKIVFYTKFSLTFLIVQMTWNGISENIIFQESIN